MMKANRILPHRWHIADEYRTEPGAVEAMGDPVAARQRIAEWMQQRVQWLAER